MRSGVIVKKVGMTRVFTDKGEHVPVTVLHLDKCQVVAQRTIEKDGYLAVQLGVGAQKAQRVTQPMRGHFAKANVEPKRKLQEFRVSKENLLEVGDMAACTLAREERQLLESALGEAGPAVIASIQVFAFDQALNELRNATEELAGAGSGS